MWARMRRAAQALAGPGAPALPVAVIEHPREAAGGAAAAACPCCRLVAAAGGRIGARPGQRRRRPRRRRLRGLGRARCVARRDRGHRHRAAAQGGAGRGRLCLSRPHRTAAVRGRGAPGPAVAAGAGAHDAGQRRTAHRAREHPHVAAPCDRGGDLRRRAADLAHRASRACPQCLGRAPRIGGRRASIRMQGRAACSARKSSEIIAPAVAAARAEGIDGQRPLRARHRLHARAAGRASSTW